MTKFTLGNPSGHRLRGFPLSVVKIITEQGPDSERPLMVAYKDDSKTPWYYMSLLICGSHERIRDNDYDLVDIEPKKVKYGVWKDIHGEMRVSKWYPLKVPGSEWLHTFEL